MVHPPPAFLLRDKRLQSLARDGVAHTTTRTANLEFFVVAKQSRRVGFHRRREHFEHALLVAATVPAINPTLQQNEGLGLVESAYLLSRQRVQPSRVAIG